MSARVVVVLVVVAVTVSTLASGAALLAELSRQPACCAAVDAVAAGDGAAARDAAGPGAALQATFGGDAPAVAAVLEHLAPGSQLLVFDPEARHPAHVRQRKRFAGRVEALLDRGSVVFSSRLAPSHVAALGDATLWVLLMGAQTSEPLSALGLARIEAFPRGSLWLLGERESP